MADKLYLLTEAELREKIAGCVEDYAGHIGDIRDEAWQYADGAMLDMKPLSPDWSKAPSSAPFARVVVDTEYARLVDDDGWTQAYTYERQYKGPWIPRPAKGDSEEHGN